MLHFSNAKEQLLVWFKRQTPVTRYVMLNLYLIINKKNIFRGDFGFLLSQILFILHTLLQNKMKKM